VQVQLGDEFMKVGNYVSDIRALHDLQVGTEESLSCLHGRRGAVSHWHDRGFTTCLGSVW